MAATKPENNARAGQWLKQSGPEPFYCFNPAPLPPNPAVDHTMLHNLSEKANRALGRLDGVVTHLPNTKHLLYTYVRKEAVLSSQIEGTQSSLSDLLLFENAEAPGVPVSDVQEVSNYAAAMEHGIKRLKELPISLRLIKEIHGVLMKHTRGSDKEPGEFRTSQNWIGGSRPGNAHYVPPPPHEILTNLGALEKFIHNDPVETPTLIKAGLVHAQFESIHPFLDGNGRVGRLLIPFILIAEGALANPLLYLSLHFKKNRTEYYAALQRVRTHGDWENWLTFYLEGVEQVATEATGTANKLLVMFEKHRGQIKGIGRASATALHLHDLFKKRCFLSVTEAQRELDTTFPAVGAAMTNLIKLGFVKEITGKQRNRIFSYEPYLKTLLEGT
ncbi:MAG TPA: Fic family protein [Elusimicrobiota bacterium]|nr:Fic family protein [Elusimicrobiota bacterium]